ncbi:choice-of-anchor J domain-containing protein [Akkermansiaceae bacterium]|nr:choice-of-anchor J domain-containing protein [Akkermansiaceae bacterium]
MGNRNNSILALASALGLGLGAGSATAQTTIDVGGAGVIGTTPLAVDGGRATVPNNGANWQAAGGAGIVYSSLTSPQFVVPATHVDGQMLTLKFTHRYNFEDDWDGGVVFANINGAGETYVDENAFSQNGYTKNNLIGSVWTDGRWAFNSATTGWLAGNLVETIATIGPVNRGDTVSITFRGGWDDAYNQPEDPASPYGSPGPAWEIGSFHLSDSSSTAFSEINFTTDGPSDFSVASDARLSGPWSYPRITSRFEITDAPSSDSYVPDTQPSVIDLNGIDVEISLLAGTLVGGEVFTLFDLTGGSTLAGSINSISLPPIGQWDTSALATAGTITFVSPPPELTWNIAGGGDWDFVTPNWIGSSTLFTDGANVTFNNPAGGVIKVVNQGTAPNRITVDSAGTYKLVSGVVPTGVANSISSGALVKNGPGTLQIGDDTLNQQFGGTPNIHSNNFSSVTINSGTLKYNSIQALGTGTLTLAGGVTVIQARVEGRIFTNNEDIKNDVVLSGGLVNLPMAFGSENKGIWISKTCTGPGGFNVTGDSRYLGLSNAGNSFGGGITLTTTATNNPAVVDFSTYTSLGTGTLTITENLITNTSPRGGLTSRADLPGNESFPNGVTNPVITATGKFFNIHCANAAHSLQLGGVISGGGTVRKWKNASTVILSGANTYTGGTRIDAGTIALGADNTLPDTAPVILGAGTLDAATFSDKTGTLDPTAAGFINLGAGGALAFADSSEVDWTGGTIEVSGTFVSGSSLRFGTDSGGLSANQIAQITVPGISPLALDDNGYLIQYVEPNFANWISGFPGVGSLTGFHDDADGDGNANGLENFFGTDPGAFTPGIILGTPGGGSFSFTHPQNPSPVSDITAPAYSWSKNLATFHADGATDGEGTTVDFSPLAGGGTATVTATVSGTPTDKLFIRVGVGQIVFNPILLDENFDADTALPAGWVSNGPVAGTNWEVGNPTGGYATGPVGGANSPDHCVGTNISSNGGEYTSSTDITLKSPILTIPGGSPATLTFAQFVDTDLTGDFASVRILDADNADAPIAGVGILNIEGDGTGAAWAQRTLEMPLPAVGGKNIRVEFRFTSDAITNYGGYYIDDVKVVIPEP